VFAKIGSLEIKQPDLSWVESRGMGFPGSEFEGLAPEERGKHIVERLQAMQKDNAIPCEALTENGKTISGYGKLEKVDTELREAQPPVMYRFYVVVAFQR
jgi:hypothetical protein